jgi:hypothetical protein
MLVPLTSSLYVPGRITDPEHVVVDIGTGYYVKKVSRHLDNPRRCSSFVMLNLPAAMLDPHG